MKPEEQLHASIRKLLDGLGIIYVRSRTDKRTTQQKGVPDFLMGIYDRNQERSVALAWECKVEGRKLSEDQEKWKTNACRGNNAWHYYTIHNFTEACHSLDNYGIITNYCPHPDR